MITYQPGKTLRLGHLMNPKSNRTLIVAVDHGLGGSPKGLESLEQSLKMIISGEPDALIMSMGVARGFQKLFYGRGKPSIIVTVDRGISSTMPGKESRGEAYRQIVKVEDALKIGADAVKMALVFGQADANVHADNIKVATEVAAECERWRVPLLLEPVLWGKTSTNEDRENPEITEHICRIAFELGADLLKVRYTGDVESFSQTVENCPIPVVILGGSKMPTERDVISTVKDAIEAGAAGIAFGRNVFQHENPAKMIKALRKIIHCEATVDSASTELK